MLTCVTFMRFLVVVFGCLILKNLAYAATYTKAIGKQRLSQKRYAFAPKFKENCLTTMSRKAFDEDDDPVPASNGTLVELKPGQTFLLTECFPGADAMPCIGIDRTRCETVRARNRALARPVGSTGEYTLWNVLLPGHCVCVVATRPVGHHDDE